MSKINVGDVVSRNSYKNDILFSVKRIIRTKDGDIVLLKGILERIEADCVIEDLKIVDKEEYHKALQKLEDRLESRLESKQNRNYQIAILTKNRKTQEKIVTGRILHLDGDKRYSEKSYRYYKKLGLNAIVKNIPEYKQPRVVYYLLKTYNPDILIVTRS